MPILSTGGFETYDELQSKITVRKNQLAFIYDALELGAPDPQMKVPHLIAELRGQVEAMQKQIDGE